jgi:hypothetical protein
MLSNAEGKSVSVSVIDRRRVSISYLMKVHLLWMGYFKMRWEGMSRPKFSLKKDMLIPSPISQGFMEWLDDAKYQGGG